LCRADQRTRVPAPTAGSGVQSVGRQADHSLAAVPRHQRVSAAPRVFCSIGVEIEAMTAQAETIRQAMAAARQADVVSTLVTQLQVVNTKLKDAQATLAARRGPQRSRNILRELVTDDTGVALHKVQVVVWTIVLCGAFLYLVGRDLEMPVFDGTLLTLMGISSGTYLGFKWPEK
jgi:hypothetical protein